MLTAIYLVCAAALLTNFDLQPFASEKIGLVFNDMARRLLHRDFSIDPKIISYEAFIRDGVTYPYYGIFPALLRMPLVALGQPMLQVGRLSCLAALGLTVYPYIRLIQHAAMGGAARSTLVACAVLSVVLTGPQVFLLASASLYHELIFWGAAFTALFNLIVKRRWLRRQEVDFHDLLRLAQLAGHCLLCRTNVGAGLYAAMLLLVRHTARGFLAVPRGDRARALLALPPWFVQPFAAGYLALLFVAAMGIVNQERWGSPLVVSPYQHYIQFIQEPTNLARYERHGLFSWVRVAAATAYYATGFEINTMLPAIFAEYCGGIEGPGLSRRWARRC
jgi:hypothetical protein